MGEELVNGDVVVDDELGALGLPLPRERPGADQGDLPAQVCEPLANSPSNLAISDQFAEMRSCAPAVVTAESCGSDAPLTVKLPAGSVSKTALTVRGPARSLASHSQM